MDKQYLNITSVLKCQYRQEEQQSAISALTKNQKKKLCSSQKRTAAMEILCFFACKQLVLLDLTSNLERKAT